MTGSPGRRPPTPPRSPAPARTGAGWRPPTPPAWSGPSTPPPRSKAPPGTVRARAGRDDRVGGVGRGRGEAPVVDEGMAPLEEPGDVDQALPRLGVRERVDHQRLPLPGHGPPGLQPGPDRRMRDLVGRDHEH